MKTKKNPIKKLIKVIKTDKVHKTLKPSGLKKNRVNKNLIKSDYFI